MFFIEKGHESFIASVILIKVYVLIYVIEDYRINLTLKIDIEDFILKLFYSGLK